MKRKLVWNGVVVQSEVLKLLDEYKKQEAINMYRKMIASRFINNKNSVWSMLPPVNFNHK